MEIDTDRLSERIRSRQIPICKELRDLLHAEWHRVKSGEHPNRHGQPITLEEWGALLAKQEGRSRPFTKSQLSKFFTGASTPEDLAFAITNYLGWPSVSLLPRSREEITWFKAGQALRDLDAKQFHKLLRNTLARVRLEHEISSVVTEDDGNPDP